MVFAAASRRHPGNGRFSRDGCFRRLPDRAGFDYWVELTAARGLDGTAVAAEFIVSPEFVQRYGSLDDHQLLDLVYRNVLGRPADAELATGTYDASLCSGFGGRVDWYTSPYEMRWCVNMDAPFAQESIDGVHVHEAIHARVGALFAYRHALTPQESAEVTRVAIESATANEGLADFWAMRLVPGHEGSPDYAAYVFNNAIWDELFARYPIGGPLPG